MKTEEVLLLAHDIGTSGTKSSLVRPDGTVAASETTPHRTVCRRPGWAEQDAADWWDGVCANSRRLMEAQPGAGARVAAIGVSGHMLGCLAVDERGAPLCPAMLHADTRAREELAEVRERVGDEAVYRTTGNILGAQSPLCKVRWLQRHAPDVYRRTHRFLQSKDFIVGRLTGSCDSTDYSDASHAQFLDLRTRRYAVDLLEAAGIEVRKLPALHAGTELIGTLAPEAAAALGLPSGIPVAAGGGDGACASVGAGVTGPGGTYACLGTTAWICAGAASPVDDARRRVFSIAGLDGTSLGVYGTVQSAGRAVDWVMALIGERGFDRFDALLEDAGPGSGGLVFLPYLEGERSPIFDADARGVFFGIDPTHGRAHFLRAVVEGVSFALRSVLDVLRERVDVPAVRLIGGGARSAGWRRILAEVFEVPVETLTTRGADATSLGAAFAAGVGVGIYANLQEAAAQLRVEARTEPTGEGAAAYARNGRTYDALYPALKGLFPRSGETTNA